MQSPWIKVINIFTLKANMLFNYLKKIKMTIKPLEPSLESFAFKVE
jgi:hypothetical protein